MIRTALLVMLLLVALSATRVPAQLPDRHPCTAWTQMLKEADLLTGDELRERAKLIYTLARDHEERRLWEPSAALLRAATSRQNAVEAMRSLTDACISVNHWAFRGVRLTPTAPTPEAEAERHLRGVLDREGADGAQCTKKQYGTGWVTVCE